MARIRTIKPEFFRHEVLQDLTILHPKLHPMLVFSGLLGHCDKNGVFEWKPRQLALDILPFVWMQSRVLLDDSLALLRDSRLIQQFDCKGKSYGFIPSFVDHQRINGKESQAPALYPQPTEDTEFVDSEIPDNQQGSDGEATEKQPRSQEGKGREEEGKRKGRGREPGVDETNSLTLSILNEANIILSKNFKGSKDAIKNIQKRVAEGRTIEEFKTVCRNMLAAWGTDEKMCQYLCPETLFGEKFDKYLNTTTNSIVPKGYASKGAIGGLERLAALNKRLAEESNAIQPQQ
ncbi:MAG: conserved phage C-terminal domain-containing protein [Bacteroidales bacterium]